MENVGLHTRILAESGYPSRFVFADGWH
jgi:hypothetical protein